MKNDTLTEITGSPLHCFKMIIICCNRVYAEGRCWIDGEARTVLALIDHNGFKPMLTLPSGGDCSYPGMIIHKKILWMSYYSTHEGKTSIYLARIKLN